MKFIPTALIPNASWSSTDSPYGQMPGAFNPQTHSTFAEPGEVMVAAGDFRDCIRVETQSLFEGGPYAKSKGRLKLLYSDWYAPRVGLVKSIARENAKEGAEVERVELIRFNVAPKR